MDYNGNSQHDRRKKEIKEFKNIDEQEKYRVLRNLIIRKSREAKEKYLEEKCSEIETLIRTRSSDEAYRMVKMFF